MFRSFIKHFHQRAWKGTVATTPVKESADKISSMSKQDLVRNMIHVSTWNKNVLVFAGRFKSTAEVPDVLPFETVDKARNYARIKVCNLMIVGTLIGCVTMVWLGKRDAAAGESITKMNMDWHKEYIENAKNEEEKKK